jgi:hypothetical protein
MIWQIKERKYLDLTEQLLFNRGLTSKKEIEAFFSPKLEFFEKDFKLPYIEKAWKRIQLAIDKQELNLNKDLIKRIMLAEEDL